MSLADLTAAILDFVGRHEGSMPFVVGVLAFGESLAVVSLFVPATAILLALGALAAASGIDFWPLWIGAALGAVAGDFASYALGHHFKHRALKVWPLERYPALVERGERFVLTHGAWGLFASRFFGPLRAVAPLIAGTFAMPLPVFYAVTMASAMVWAFAMIAPGAGLVAILD